MSQETRDRVVEIISETLESHLDGAEGEMSDSLGEVAELDSADVEEIMGVVGPTLEETADDAEDEISDGVESNLDEKSRSDVWV